MLPVNRDALRLERVADSQADALGILASNLLRAGRKRRGPERRGAEGAPRRRVVVDLRVLSLHPRAAREVVLPRERVDFAIRRFDSRSLAVLRLLELVNELVVAQRPDEVRGIGLLVGEAVALELLRGGADFQRAESDCAEDRVALLLRKRDHRGAGRRRAECSVLLLVVGVADIDRAAGIGDARRAVLRVERRRSAFVDGVMQPEREAAPRRRPVLDHVLVTTVERLEFVAKSRAVHRGAESTQRHVAERVDRGRRDLERSIPTAEEDATPATLQADRAVASRERGVVLVRLECRFELEKRLESAPQIFRAANTQA